MFEGQSKCGLRAVCVSLMEPFLGALLVLKEPVQRMMIKDTMNIAAARAAPAK